MTHTTEGKQMTANLIERAKAALENATPGPWRIVPYDAGDKDEWSIWTPMIDGSEEADRAVVHWAGFKQKYWQSADGKQSEIESNADLIALAPDLARALIREREAAERLAEAAKFNAAIDSPLGRPSAPRAVMLEALAAYRKATKETDDDK